MPDGAAARMLGKGGGGLPPLFLRPDSGEAGRRSGAEAKPQAAGGKQQAFRAILQNPYGILPL